MQDRGDVRLGTAGDESGRPGTIEDGQGWVRTAGDCVGRPGMGEDGGGRRGTAGDHTNDVSWFQPGGTEGPSAKTIVPYSLSGPYPPGHSPS